jgi:hypothetical protein
VKGGTVSGVATLEGSRQRVVADVMHNTTALSTSDSVDWILCELRKNNHIQRLECIVDVSHVARQSGVTNQ